MRLDKYHPYDGPVRLTQKENAMPDQPLKSETESGSRSIHVGRDAIGSNLTSGDNNDISLNFQKVALPPPESVNISKELAALRNVLTQLKSPDQSKIENALADANSELTKPTPDKSEMGDAIGRALKYAKQAADFTKVIESVKGPVIGIASWLGTNVNSILAAVGLSS